MTTRFERIKDELGTAYCRHFCHDHCKATPENDQCFCEEASIVGAEVMEKYISSGFITVAKRHDDIAETKTSVG